MKPYRASELREFLESLQVDAKKGLSQNFLIDGNILKKMMVAADIQEGDAVLEIGPGPGALTQCLLEKGVHVTAVEIDPLFAKALERLARPPGTLQIIAQDFLKLPLEPLLQKPPPSAQKWKVVTNLPYHITTPILTRLLPHHAHITSVTAMVQKEFAQRMVARPGSSEYGSFSLFTAFYSKARYCFTVPPTCFYPRPKVDSAVVHCTLHLPPNVAEEVFFKITRTAFHTRRKMLKTSLKKLIPPAQLEAALRAMNLPITARPEELSLEQFATIAQLC